MRTDQILNLDYREEESKEIIQKVLRKIKPLSRYSLDEDVPIEALEKLIKVMVHKYEITPQWINITYDEPILAIYSVGVKETVNHEWLEMYMECVSMNCLLSYQSRCTQKSRKVKYLRDSLLR